MTALLSIITFLVGVAISRGHYYLPGVSPKTFQQYESVPLYVSKITSVKTQMPYDYYSLPYCKPKKAGLQFENLGEVLSGDRIENSVYKLEVKVPEACEVACVMTLKKSKRTLFEHAIDNDYRVHWIVDNLPVGTMSYVGQTPTFTRGFPVGFSTGTGKDRKRFLNNHVRIIIQYHDDVDSFIEGSAEEQTTKIVGFRVEPMSIKHQWEGREFLPGTTVLTTCNAMSPPSYDPKSYLPLDNLNTIIYTYDVFWEKSTTEWSNRWDVYITANSNSNSDKVHWFSISNSFMIVLFLSTMIAFILHRSLRNDIKMYNDPAAMEEAKDESGWKLVHGDVFRPPTSAPMLFSVLVGTGVQLGLMISVTLIFCFLGLLSPANRGSLVTGLIFLFVVMGAFAGYYSSMTYKMFRGTEWRNNIIMTALLFPATVFIAFFCLNIILWAEGSSGAVPFGTLFILLFLWFCVSVPLVFIGSFFGYKREVVTFPVRTNQIPRAIPVQAWYMHPWLTCALAGILPFGAVSVELYFIMSALWLHQIFFIFGFLVLVGIVLIITCAEIAILLCYFQLCAEDYRWWWRSFFTAGSCAAYLILYSLWYNMTEMDMTGIAPFVLYTGYMCVISLTFFIVTGTIGYFACFWFNCLIYGSIKVD